MEATIARKQDRDQRIRQRTKAVPDESERAAQGGGASAGVPLFLKSHLRSGEDEPLQEPAPPTAQEEEPAAALPLQPKLAVGAVDDPLEREADQVAERVSRMVSGGESLGVQRSVVEVRGKFSGASGGGEEPLQAKGVPELNAGTEAKIAALRGQGGALPDGIRQEMEARLGADFTSVSIHTGGEAAALCEQVGARAFTVGSDIFFAAGEYAPDTEPGRRLLVHELTHVVQQSGGMQRLSRAVEPAVERAEDPAVAAALADLERLELPPIKHRHAALYTGAGARRAAGYRRNTSEEQVDIWRRDVRLTLETIAEKLSAIDPDFVVPESDYAAYSFRIRSRSFSGQWRGLRNRLLIPDWDRQGTTLEERRSKFQVDHMVELQVFGDTTGNAGNVIGNMELLKGSANASSGAAIKNSIYRKVKALLAAQDPNFERLAESTKNRRRRNFLDQHTITFTQMVRAEGREGRDTDWWTRSEIESGAHLELLQPGPDSRLIGSSGNFVLASGAGGVEIARYRYRSLDFEPSSHRLKRALAGVEIERISLTPAAEQGEPGSEVGQLHATWDLPNGFRTGEAVVIPLVAIAPYCASPGQIPALNTDFEHLSPVTLPNIEVRDGGLYAEGELTPSIPLFANAPLRVCLDGGDLRFEFEYVADMLNIPLPGISMDEGAVSLFYSSEEGFGGAGRIDFSIDRLGAGNLEARVSQRDGFSAAGEFDFDSELFDRARVRVWYRDSAFGGEGEIGIDSPDKVRGIEAANLAVSFSRGEFAASGDVTPAIPGVEQAGLSVEYSEEEGLTIGGTLQLSSDVPGIESGSIDVTVTKQGEAWRVAASGRAVPAIPGINSELSIDYNDGAFTAEVTAQYERGMLSGEILAGVTNRSVGEAGELSETAEPDSPLIVYGGGSLTLQIAPWLQGRAGVRFAPDGELTVSGEIGLPDQLEIFARREIDKSIFSIAVQAPIVPGIVAEIGGGLSAEAGIGPGVIDQLRLGITYNPAREEETTVTGDAHLEIPADAGLRLSVRAGVGLGITGASATGGLEIGGALGISGAAEAGVHVEWSPASGLELNADVSLHAQPSFTFDISGYVSVRALGMSLYDETYELSSFEFGSDYRFGITLPVHYQEGEPFDISLDDVEFEVPDIDTDRLLRDLVARVA